MNEHIEICANCECPEVTMESELSGCDGVSILGAIVMAFLFGYIIGG